MKPGIIIVPIQVRSPLELLVLVNLVTMTPGTLAIDVAADRSAVYVHALYIDDPDELRKTLEQGFLKRIREIFK
jgi:multicomponent Na+:H+ antiporter subunit E